MASLPIEYNVGSVEIDNYPSNQWKPKIKLRRYGEKLKI
jgi:hypothetical protein